MIKRLLTILVLCAASLCNAQDLDCFAIVAGREATVDGSVLFAHNEDGGGEMMLNVYVVPATNKTVRYIWCEFPGRAAADSYMNQYGVSVASNGCPCREDKGEFKGKGVSYEIRQSVAKYARTAREGVEIISSMVETFGYNNGGRCYTVADPVEAWVVAVVQGKHWVAQRVPDDKVMVLPNCYTIGAVDLSDEANFAGSDDIVTYARSRGWYDPAKDGEFSFAKAYGTSESPNLKGNLIRQKEAWRFFFGQDRPGEFASVPLNKVSVRDMMEALAIHEPADKSGKLANGICNEGTVLSSIFHLRNDRMFNDGCVMWLAMGHPCSEVFVPWYAGVTEAPEGMARYDYSYKAERKHFSDAKDLRKRYPDYFYWNHADNWSPYKDNSKKQRAVFAARKKFEESPERDYNAFIRSMYKK